MAIVDSAYSSLLQGVSQQADTSKREGQLKEQINMWSDPVTGLRRRGGVATKAVLPVTTENGKAFITEYENSAGTFYILWNLLNHTAYVFNSAWVLTDTKVISYLNTASSIQDIGTASVGDTGFVLNRKVVPTVSNTDTNARNPIYDGFVLIRTGAFSRSYTINVSVVGIGSFDFAYTTDTTAANSTPEAIATQFKTQMDANATFSANFDVIRDGAMLFIYRSAKSPTITSNTTVTSNNGSTYVLTSGAMNLAQSSDLPAKMPYAASYCVVSVGTSDLAKSYYYWDSSNAIWVETTKFGSYNSISGMPLPYTVSTTGVLTLVSNTYPLRTAGDDNNNPYHNFVTQGITGISCYQGRLVLLSGSYASTSSSLDYTKFMRTTVTSLVSTDGFEVGSSKTAGAKFKYAVQFNKDLVILGDKHQAVIPSSNTAITPANATMVPTGNAHLGLTCAPVSTPRTVIVPNSNTKYVRVGEIVPSTLVDSQYTYQEVTDHLPSYMQGTPVCMTESSTNSHVVVLGDTKTNQLLSHEYYWDGDTRKQMAFSTWSFSLPLATVHYSRDNLIVVAVAGSNTIIASTDKHALKDGGNHYMDFYKETTAVDQSLTVPTELQPYVNQLEVASNEATLRGETVGSEVTGVSLKLVRSYKDADVVIGLPIEASATPAAPVLKDNKDVAITDSKIVLKRYLVSLINTGAFDISVSSGIEDVELVGEPVLWRSTDLGFGKPLVASSGDVAIPIGIPVGQARVTLSTKGTRELNIKDIQYTLKVEVRPQRRRL